MTARSYLLIDGALARGSSSLPSFDEQVALYADLGQDAAMVGPWLVANAGLEAFELLPLPLRHGVSELHTSADIAQLLRHLHQLRRICTADGLTFYARYADTRALHSLASVLKPIQLDAFLGPVNKWQWVDRHGHRQQLSRASADASSGMDRMLSLSDDQLMALLQAMLPDQLAAAVSELEEPGLAPDEQADQFDLIRAHVVPFLKDQCVEGWRFQRAIARQFVLHGASLSRNASFRAALERAERLRSSEVLDEWRPADLNTPTGGETH